MAFLWSGRSAVRVTFSYRVIITTQYETTCKRLACQARFPNASRASSSTKGSLPILFLHVIPGRTQSLGYCLLEYPRSPQLKDVRTLGP